MRLFFKHLINSIRRRPLQPFILLITLILSIVVCTSSLSLGNHIDKEAEIKQAVQYGNADFTVSINAQTSSRFMFTKDVEDVLGDGAKACGVYELPLYFSEQDKTAFGAATDFSEINDVFTLEFSEYSTITTTNQNDVALVSRDFLSKYSLKIGDEFTANVLGYVKTYKVAAVSETPYLASYDVLVNVTGVMRLLASDSLFVSALGDDLKPCNTVYVNVLDDGAVESCITALKARQEFSDKDFSIVANAVKATGSLDALSSVVLIVVALSLLLSAAVVFCCFYIISAQRIEENALFKAVGAKPLYLRVIQFAEIILYWLIAAPIGIVAAMPFVDVITNFVGFKFVTVEFDLLLAVLSALIVLSVSIFTVLCFVIVEARPAKARRKINLVPYFLVATVLTFVLTIVLPIDFTFIAFCVATITLFLTVFYVVPITLKKVVGALDRARMRKIVKGKTNRPSFDYALKNVGKLSVLQNSCRLLVIIISCVIIVVATVAGAKNVIATYSNQFNGQYLIANATESCEQKVSDLKSVESIYSLYSGLAKAKGEKTIDVIGVSDRSALSSDIDLKSLPTGNQATLCRALAKTLKVGVGDQLSISIGGVNIDLVVSEVRNDVVNMLIFNNENFDLPFNYLIIDGVDGVKNEELRNELSAATALEMAAIVSIDHFTEQKTQASELYLNSGYFLLPLMIVFGIIGFVDNLFESYRSRKQEFDLYKAAGASSSQVIRMKFMELAITFVLALMISVVTVGAAFILLDYGLTALDYSFLLSLFGGA